jgi:prophage regulatory protein
VWRIERDRLEAYIADQYEATRRRIAEADGQSEPPQDEASDD